MVDLPHPVAGFYEEPYFIIWDLFFQLRHELRPFRTRTHEGDVAADDVPKLGQFVQMARAEKLSERRHACVIGSRRPLCAVLFRVRSAWCGTYTA